MEIYKLSDNLTNKHKCDILESSGEDFDALKITNLKQGVKNENRVNVYVNNKYAFSLDIAQVVELGVKVGKNITEDELKELKRASEYGKLYQRTLEWALVRPRSEREVKDYLAQKIRKSFTEGLSGFSTSIIQRLVEKGYVDDRKFAEYYIENRFVKKGVSEKRLRMELMRKGVDKNIIDEALRGTERNDAEEIKKIIARKRARYDDEKLVQYLCRQGFSFDLARELVLQYGKD